MNYQPIYTIKESEKATVMLAALEGHIGPVVIKKLQGASPDIYRLLCHARNSHIPQVFAYEQQGDELIVAEEYVDGENLGEYVKKNLLSDKEKLEFALQLCEAVEFLHFMEPPLIHRDIKPSNILITGRGVLKLIDYDASRQYKEQQNSKDTRLLGTAEYAPPEQFGYSQTDVRSDIYSMGVVFHEMCPVENKKLAEQWDRIVEKCTSFDPKNRYQNVNELAAEIKDLLPEKKRRVQRICKIIGIAGLLGTVLGTAILLPKQGKEADSTVTDNTVVAELPKEYLFYKGLSEDTEVILSKDFFDDAELKSGTCYNNATKEMIEIPVGMLENGPGYVRIADEFMMTLEPAVYQIEILFSGTEDGSELFLKTVVEVYSEEVQPEQTESVLWNSEGKLYSDYPQDIAVVISSDASCRINGLYFRFTEPAAWAEFAELERLQAWCYDIVCDGKVMIIKKEYLKELYSESGAIEVFVSCDDGSLQVFQIELLPGIPEGVSLQEEQNDEIPVATATPMPMTDLYPDIEKVPQRIWYSYYQSYRTDFLVADEKYREYELFDYATYYCFQTGLTEEIPSNMLEACNGYMKVSEQFMMSLEPYVYEFTFYYNGLFAEKSVYRKTVKVYPKETAVIPAGTKLIKGEQTVYSEYPGVVTNVIRNGENCKIIGAYIMNQNSEKKDIWPYEIDLDGRVISVQGEYFKPYYNQGFLILYIILDNGNTEEMQINFVEGIPDVFGNDDNYKRLLANVTPYYKALAEKTDLIFGHNMTNPNLNSAQCNNIVTNQTQEIPSDMLEIGTGYICVYKEYMKLLEPGLYKFIFDMNTVKTELVVQIYPEEAIPKQQQINHYFWSLDSVCYLGDMPGVKGVLRNDLGCRITGVFVKEAAGTEIAVDAEGYVIGCEGRYILVKDEFLRQYLDEEKITLCFTFDDGGQQQTEIILDGAYLQ